MGTLRKRRHAAAEAAAPAPHRGPRATPARHSTGSEGNLYEVEHVLAQRDGAGGHELLVRWQGYGAADDQWTSRAELLYTAPIAVAEFDARCGAHILGGSITKRRRRDRVATATAVVTQEQLAVREIGRAPRRTAEQDEQQLQQWIQDHRNTNTARAYNSGMRQFVKWAQGSGSAQLLVPINVDRPSQANVAAYMRYMVMELRRPMTTVGTHLSAIANHVRFVEEEGYSNPTRGPLIKAMRVVLTDYAPRPGGHQKQALSWDTLGRIHRAMERAMDPRAIAMFPGSVRWMARRDQAMILMGFFFLLRRSEVARMRRDDVSVTLKEGTATKVLQVYVNEKSKNDRERRGHVRVAAGRPGKDICVLRALARYILECEQGEPRRISRPEDSLFPRLEGGPMAEDTPNGRLQHWLRVAGVEAPTSYGFHSLRAGAATEAYRNGATEEWIKQHGNWKSDAVKIYIRQGLEEKLATTAVLGQGGSRAAAAAAGRSL